MSRGRLALLKGGAKGLAEVVEPGLVTMKDMKDVS